MFLGTKSSIVCVVVYLGTILFVNETLKGGK